MSDLDDIEAIADQNRMRVGRKDNRGQKSKGRGIPLFRNPKIRRSKPSTRPVTLSGGAKPPHPQS